MPSTALADLGVKTASADIIDLFVFVYYLILFVFVVAEPGKEGRTIKKIEALGLGLVSASNSNQIIVDIDKTPKGRSGRTRLEAKFKGISGVLRAELVSPHVRADIKLKEALRTNSCGIFFDIDGTLTQGDPGTVNHKIKHMFDKIVDKGIRIFFVTGRSMPDLSDLMRDYKIGRYAIAENGGLLLGFGPDGYVEFGDRKEPDKVLEYLQVKYGTPEDMRQDMRLTEVIFLKKDVTVRRLETAVKAQKASVDIHASKNSYHVSKKGINKGTAMLELCRRIRFGNRMMISVGDADMDIPMLEKADYSFAVGNASPGAKKAANRVLRGRYEKGIEEIFNLIDHT